MRTASCLFCRIVAGQESAFRIWEDSNHIAVLTPYPNTPGFTVLFTKTHLSSYIFDLSDGQLINLMQAGRIVAKLLDRAFGNARSAMIAEGMSIDHAHMKIVPLHGVRPGEWRAVHSNRPNFTPVYLGYVSSEDGPRMSATELIRLRDNIIAAAS